jgi:hypothetical protein
MAAQIGQYPTGNIPGQMNPKPIHMVPNRKLPPNLPLHLH